MTYFWIYNWILHFSHNRGVGVYVYYWIVVHVHCVCIMSLAMGYVTIAGAATTSLGLYSLSWQMSYCKISSSRKAASFGFKLFQSLWNSPDPS